MPAYKNEGCSHATLTDALRNAIPYMTPEESRETLFRTIEKLDELYGNRSRYEEVLRKEREAHDLEISSLKEKIAAKDRSLAEKDRSLAEKERAIAERERAIDEINARIAELDKKLAESKAANVDARP